MAKRRLSDRITTALWWTFYLGAAGVVVLALRAMTRKRTVAVLPPEPGEPSEEEIQRAMFLR